MSQQVAFEYAHVALEDAGHKAELSCATTKKSARNFSLRTLRARSRWGAALRIAQESARQYGLKVFESRKDSP
jgi:hypothetical protein